MWIWRRMTNTIVSLALRGPVLTSAWIIVRHKETPFISVPIDAELNPRFDMVSDNPHGMILWS